MSWLVNPYMLGSPIDATGGYISYYTSGPDIFVVHKFIDIGTNTFSVSAGAGDVDYLIVAGGGSGGGGWQGGGGGGGGVLQGTYTVSQNNYSVVIGAGGISAITGTNGDNSSAFGLTAIGGGRGAGEPLGSSYASQTGGSGGGGSHSGGLTGSNGTSGQGTKGGDGHSTTGNYVGGGGGGASTAGANATSTAAGNGGEGLSISITGTAKVYGSGGGGSRRDGGTQGIGGTGAGSGVNGTGGSGTPNTGAGGGSGWGTNGVGVGGAGGSGIVVIRYKIQTSPTYITAYGGNTIRYYNDYGNNKWFIHSFTNTGSQNFVVSSGSSSVNYLIVAGGGGGGCDFGGGGGAGGLRRGQSSITTGTYPIVVGTGGTGAAITPTQAGVGGDSSFNSIVATGGGGGGNGSGRYLSGTVQEGGSGGGAGSYSVTSKVDFGLGNTPSTSPSQGNNGGQGFGDSGNTASGSGGGGGAGAVGSNGASGVGGKGGDGIISYISGTGTYYAGGGGGGAYSTSVAGAGGLGGGGNGATGTGISGSPGAANTGGGGGGNSGGGAGAGGNGGTGIVILRYPAQDLGIVTDNLSLYLDADLPQSYPGSGTTWYDLGNGRNGTLTSGPTYATTNGGVINFDGIDDYVTGTIPSTAIANVSVQLWVNITGGTEGGTFFKQGNNSGGFAVGIGGTTFENAGTNLIFLFSAVRWAATTTSLGSGWKMVTMILNASSVISAYINDTPVASIPTGGNPVAPTTSYNLGRCIGDEGTSRQYLGGIATCMFYTSALTQANVTQNFNAFRGRYGV